VKVWGGEVFQIDLKSRKAIYEQVVDNFKRLITTKMLAANAKVPSVRELAGMLDVNPNTVQKAYRELEAQGFFYTVLGQGSFISSPPDEPDKANSRAVKEKLAALRETVRELLYHGMELDEIIKHIKTENNESGAESVDKN
jgi:GntR family transcriptional regulator